MALLLAVGTGGDAAAFEVSWGSEGVSRLRTAAGDPIEEAFCFELGFFEPGFVPTEDNVGEWGRHWTLVHGLGVSEAAGVFADRAEIEVSGAPPGACWCLWGFDRRDEGVEAAGKSEGWFRAEWILLTNDAWRTPPEVGGGGDGALPPAGWFAGDAGTWAVVGEVARLGGDGELVLQTARLTVGPTLDFDEWREVHFTPDEMADAAATGALADPDGDGGGNLLEFAFGTDPLGAAARPPEPVVGFVLIDGNRHLAIAVTRNPAAEVRWIVEASDDLARWESGGERIAVLVDEPETLVAFDRRAIDVGDPGRRFLRVRVTR